MLEYFGSITVADVMKAKSASEYERFVVDWAKCVWGAYARYQQMAREWVIEVEEFRGIRRYYKTKKIDLSKVQL